MKKTNVHIILFISLLIISIIPSYISQRAPDQFQINLDLSPRQRYKEVAHHKKQLINKFIDFLHTNTKYKVAFKTARSLSLILKNIVGTQFYQQCYGIAETVGRHVSQLVVFNYMYQLGAYNDFCTSIGVQNSESDYFLARNLDYGFQQYLANNSIKLNYKKNSNTIFITIGHAGLIGAHTALRIDGYAVTLNQRIDAGLHVTLQQIFLMRSQTVPYLVQKTLRKAQTIEQAQHMLASTRVCAAVYYILNGKGRNIVIQKERKGAKAIYQNKKYIVQTNTDRQLVDPDNRRDVAQSKMLNLSYKSKTTRQNVWNILTQPPNFNKLTLITVLLDTSRNNVNATVWV